MNRLDRLVTLDTLDGLNGLNGLDRLYSTIRLNKTKVTCADLLKFDCD